MKDLIEWFSTNLSDYYLVIMISIWGGTAAYINRLKNTVNGRWSISELLGEWIISGFSGLLAAYITTSLHAPHEITFFMAGVSGHMGARAISIFEKSFEKYFQKDIKEDNK